MHVDFDQFGISICIPTYKQAGKLRVLLKSIEAQTIQVNEIIVSDDSDTDDVEQVCNEFNLPIKYFRNEVALGSPENWNAAIRKSSFRWVKLMHHDDFFSHENALELFIQFVKKERGSDYVFCATTVLNSLNESSYVYGVDKSLLSKLNQFPAYLLHKNLIGAPSTGFFRREVQIQYDSRLIWLVDIEFYLRLLMKYKVGYLDNPAITTVMFEGQLTSILKDNREVELSEFLYCYMKHIDFLNGFNKRIIRSRMIELIRKFNVRSIKEVKFDLTDKRVPTYLKLFFCLSKINRRLAFGVFYRLNKFKI